jgi:hypothetical protein
LSIIRVSSVKLGGKELECILSHLCTFAYDLTHHKLGCVVWDWWEGTEPWCWPLKSWKLPWPNSCGQRECVCVCVFSRSDRV